MAIYPSPGDPVDPEEGRPGRRHRENLTAEPLLFGYKQSTVVSALFIILSSIALILGLYNLFSGQAPMIHQFSNQPKKVDPEEEKANQERIEELTEAINNAKGENATRAKELEQLLKEVEAKQVAKDSSEEIITEEARKSYQTNNVLGFFPLVGTIGFGACVGLVQMAQKQWKSQYNIINYYADHPDELEQLFENMQSRVGSSGIPDVESILNYMDQDLMIHVGRRYMWPSGGVNDSWMPARRLFEYNLGNIKIEGAKLATGRRKFGELTELYWRPSKILDKILAEVDLYEAAKPSGFDWDDPTFNPGLLENWYMSSAYVDALRDILARNDVITVGGSRIRIWQHIRRNLWDMNNNGDIVLREASPGDLQTIRLDTLSEIMDYYSKWNSEELINWLVEENVDENFSEIAETFRLGGKGNPFTNMRLLGSEHSGEVELTLVFLIACIIFAVWTICCALGCLENKCKVFKICRTCSTLGF